MIRLVVKSDKSIKLCMNLIPLNVLAEINKYLLSHVQNILDMVQGNHYFSVLDLKKGIIKSS